MRNRGQAHGVQARAMPPNPSVHEIPGFEASFGKLEQRVSGLEGSLAGISSAIQSLSTRFDERNRTPWGVIASAAGVVLVIIGGVGGLAWSPIRESLTRIETTVGSDRSRNESRLDRFADIVVTRADLDARLAATGARRDDWQRNAEQREVDDRKVVEKLIDTVVPRGELAEHWRQLDNTLADKQRQIDELRRQADQLYGPRDELTRLSREVEELRAKLPRG